MPNPFYNHQEQEQNDPVVQTPPVINTPIMPPAASNPIQAPVNPYEHEAGKSLAKYYQKPGMPNSKPGELELYLWHKNGSLNVNYKPSAVNSKKPYWAEPQRVVRYKQMLDSTSAPVPEWLDRQKVNTLYNYLEFINPGKKSEDWASINDDDPNYGMVEALTSPPQDLLPVTERDPVWQANAIMDNWKKRYEEEYVEYDRLVKEYNTEYANKFAKDTVKQNEIDFAKLEPFSQFLVATQAITPGKNKPKWMETVELGSMGVKTGMMATGALSMFTSAIGTAAGAGSSLGPIGTAIGVVGGAAFGLYAMYLAKTGNLEGATKIMAVFNKPAEWTEQALGMYAGKEQMAALGADTSKLNSSHFYEAGRSFYESQFYSLGNLETNIISQVAHALNPNWSSGKTADIGEVWQIQKGIVEPQALREGYMAGNALAEATMRLYNGESSTLVYEDMVDRYGYSGTKADFILQSWIDPVQFMPYALSLAGEKIAGWAKQPQMADSFKSVRGNLAADAMPGYLQMPAQMAIGLYNRIALKNTAIGDVPHLINFRPSGGLFDVIDDYRYKLRTASAPMGVMPKMTDEYTGFDRLLGKIDKDTGMPKESTGIDTQGNVANKRMRNILSDRTPLAKIVLLKDNLAGAIENLWERSGHNIDKLTGELNKVIGGKASVVTGEAATYYYDSPEARALAGALKAGMGDKGVKNIMQAWQTLAPQRAILNDLSIGLKARPEDILLRIEKGETSALLEEFKNSGLADTNNTLRSLLNNTLDAEQTNKLFKTMIRDKIPVNTDLMFLRFTQELDKGMGSYLVKNYGVPENEAAFFRGARLNKSIQSLVLLGLNPTFLVKNFLNNVSTMAYQRVGGIYSASLNDAVYIKYGIIPPARADEGYSMIGIIPKSKKGSKDIIDKAQNVVSKVTEKAAVISNTSMKLEKACSASVVATGVDYVMREDWLSGKAIGQMPAQVQAELRGKGYDPNDITSLIRATTSTEDMGKGPNKKVHVTIKLNEAVEATFSKLGLDPEIGNDFLSKTGITDALTRYINEDGMSFDGALDTYKRTLDYHTTQLRAEELIDTYKEGANVVHNSGQPGGVHMLNQMQQEEYVFNNSMQQKQYEAMLTAREIRAAAKDLSPAEQNKAFVDANAQYHIKQIEVDNLMQQHLEERVNTIAPVLNALDVARPEQARYVSAVIADHKAYAKFQNDKIDAYDAHFDPEAAVPAKWEDVQAKIKEIGDAYMVERTGIRNEMAEATIGLFGDDANVINKVKAWLDASADIQYKIEDTDKKFAISLSKKQGEPERDAAWLKRNRYVEKLQNKALEVDYAHGNAVNEAIRNRSAEPEVPEAESIDFEAPSIHSTGKYVMDPATGERVWVNSTTKPQQTQVDPETGNFRAVRDPLQNITVDANGKRTLKIDPTSGHFTKIPRSDLDNVEVLYFNDLDNNWMPVIQKNVDRLSGRYFDENTGLWFTLDMHADGYIGVDAFGLYPGEQHKQDKWFDNNPDKAVRTTSILAANKSSVGSHNVMYQPEYHTVGELGRSQEQVAIDNAPLITKAQSTMTYDEYQVKADVEKRLLNINRIEKKYREGWINKNATELKELTAVIETDFHYNHEEARAAVALMCVKAEEFTFRTKQIDPMAYIRRYQYEAVDQSVFDLDVRKGIASAGTGRTSFDVERGKWVIQASQKANGTTWLHEMAHTWIADLDMDDLNILAKHTGYKSGIEMMESEKLFRSYAKQPGVEPPAEYKAFVKAQEQIVAAFEQTYYKKPMPLNELQMATTSPSITRGFQHLMANFRNWIVKLYDNMRGVEPATGQAKFFPKNRNSSFGITISPEVEVALYHLYNGYRKDQVWQGDPTFEHQPASMVYMDDLYSTMNGGKHLDRKWYDVSPEELQSVVDLAAPKITTDVTPITATIKTKGGFEDKGKGTPAGDGKDKAMRQVASYFVGEIADETKASSTKTSYGTIKAKTDKSGDVVMLARNAEFNNRPLQDTTKSEILKHYKVGRKFVVGDMPGVDSAFVDYLNEIGADYTIYHAGNTNRLGTSTVVTAAPSGMMPVDQVVELIYGKKIVPDKKKMIAETAQQNFGKNTILDITDQYYKDFTPDTQSALAADIRMNSSVRENLQPGTSLFDYVTDNKVTPAQLEAAIIHIEQGKYNPKNQLQWQLMFRAINNLKEGLPQISRFMNLTPVDKIYNALDQLDEQRLAPLIKLSEIDFDPDDGLMKRDHWMANTDYLEETHTKYQELIQDIRNNKNIPDDVANRLIYRGRTSVNKVNTIIDAYEKYSTSTYIKSVMQNAEYNDPSSEIIGQSNMLIEGKTAYPETNIGVQDATIPKELGLESIYRKDAESSLTPEQKAAYATLETRATKQEDLQAMAGMTPEQQTAYLLERSRGLSDEPEAGPRTNPIPAQSPEDQAMIRYANEATMIPNRSKLATGFERELEDTYVRTKGKGPEWDAILVKAKNLRSSILSEVDDYNDPGKGYTSMPKNRAEALKYIEGVLFPRMNNLNTDASEATFNIKRQVVQPDVMTVEEYHKQNPNALYQPDPGPALHNNIDSLPTTLKQGKAWREQAADVAIMLKTLRESYNSNTKSYGYKGIDQLSPEARALFDKWLVDAGTQLGNTKQKAIRYGLAQRDSALLNYGDRNGFDNYLDLLFPYQFWYTRSMQEWVKRSLNRPSILALAGRRAQMAEKLGKDMGEYPSRLQNKYKIPWAFAEKWMGDNVYMNPWMDLMPVNQLLQPLDLLNQQYTSLRPDLVLQNMVQDGEITQEQMDVSLKNQNDENWTKAMAAAQENSDTEDPYALLSMMMTPNWLINEVEAKITGRKLPNQPLTNVGLAIQSHGDTIGNAIGKSDPKIGEAIKDALAWAGKAFEQPEKVIRGNNFAYYGKWGEWLVKRELSNMAAEGRDVTAIRQSMIEGKGDLWAEASKRVRDQVSLKMPGSLLARTIEEGEYHNMPWAIVATLFPAGIFPEGEMTQLGLKADMQKAWDVAAETGDKTALNDWFKAHPEYMARAALNDDDDTMLKKFLVNQIMDAYTSEANINKSLIKAHLGNDFLNKILNPDSTNGKIDYKALDTEKLVSWARTMKKEIPLTDETIKMNNPVGKIDTYTPEQITELTTFFDEREVKFPDHQELNDRYGQLQTEREKEIFLAKYPELKKYWDYAKDYRSAHATVKAWSAKYSDPNEVAHDPYYGLDPAKIQGYYDYKQTNFPNVGWLNTEYFQIPEKSYAAKRNFLTKYPELKAYWDWKDVAEKADPEYLYYNKMQDATYTKKDIEARTPADLKPAQVAQALAVLDLDSFVKQDLLDYYVRKTELPFGTKAALRALWEERGKPGSNFEDFVDNLF